VSDGSGTVWGVATATGRRSGNEDSYLADPPVFVVADGMGGHEAGEVASAIVVQEFDDLRGRASVEPEDLFDRIERGAARIRALPAPPGRGAGTTLAGVALSSRAGAPYWLVVNIGDSRVYRAADGVLEQVTVDHSEVQELIDAGELTTTEADSYARRHVVTRAVGAFAEVKPELWMLPAGPRDRMLICSDGLTGELSDEAIADILLASSSPQQAADALVRAALANGGHDNVTVVVVDGTGLDDDWTVPSVVEADDDTLPREELEPMAGTTP
jgi:protein phosphatase